MYNIKFVQSGSNFALFSKIKKYASNQNLTQWATILFPEGLENTTFNETWTENVYIILGPRV